MKESGKEGRDHFPLTRYAGSRNPSLALLACLACSPSPTKPWESLWRRQDLCSMNYLLSIYWSFSNRLLQQVKNGMFLSVANYCWFAFVTSHCEGFIKPLVVSRTPHAQFKKTPDVNLSRNRMRVHRSKFSEFWGRLLEAWLALTVG